LAAVAMLAGALLAGVPLSIGCGAPQAGAEQDSSPARAVWRPLGTWSGRGNRQTESFDVTTGALRLRWEASNDLVPEQGRLRVVLYSAISGRPLQTIIDHRGTGAGEASFEDEPRVTYLVVESEDVEWTLTLEEAVPVK
jgi:hypothetical protein